MQTYIIISPIISLFVIYLLYNISSKLNSINKLLKSGIDTASVEKLDHTTFWNEKDLEAKQVKDSFVQGYVKIQNDFKLESSRIQQYNNLIEYYQKDFEKHGIQPPTWSVSANKS